MEINDRCFFIHPRKLQCSCKYFYIHYSVMVHEISLMYSSCTLNTIQHNNCSTQWIFYLENFHLLEVLCKAIFLVRNIPYWVIWISMKFLLWTDKDIFPSVLYSTFGAFISHYIWWNFILAVLLCIHLVIDTSL